MYIKNSKRIIREINTKKNPPEVLEQKKFQIELGPPGAAVSRAGSNRAAESVRVFFYIISALQGSGFWVDHKDRFFFLLPSK